MAAQMGGCHYYATRTCAPVCSTHACLDLLGRISWLHMALKPEACAFSTADSADVATLCRSLAAEWGVTTLRKCASEEGGA